MGMNRQEMARRARGSLHVIVPWLIGGALAVYAFFFAMSPLADPDDWFYVEEPLKVSYDEEGTLTVCISSEIRHTFSAQWRTTVRKINGSAVVPMYHDGAEAEREYDYVPREFSEFCEPWTDYTNMQEPTEPGLYELEVTWPMIDDTRRKVVQRARSHLFRVPDAE